MDKWEALKVMLEWASDNPYDFVPEIQEAYIVLKHSIQPISDSDIEETIDLLKYYAEGYNSIETGNTKIVSKLFDTIKQTLNDKNIRIDQLIMGGDKYLQERDYYKSKLGKIEEIYTEATRFFPYRGEARYKYITDKIIEIVLGEDNIGR